MPDPAEHFTSRPQRQHGVMGDVIPNLDAHRVAGTKETVEQMRQKQTGKRLATGLGLAAVVVGVMALIHITGSKPKAPPSTVSADQAAAAGPGEQGNGKMPIATSPSDTSFNFVVPPAGDARRQPAPAVGDTIRGSGSPGADGTARHVPSTSPSAHGPVLPDGGAGLALASGQDGLSVPQFGGDTPVHNYRRPAGERIGGDDPHGSRDGSPGSVTRLFGDETSPASASGSGQSCGPRDIACRMHRASGFGKLDGPGGGAAGSPVAANRSGLLGDGADNATAGMNAAADEEPSVPGTQVEAEAIRGIPSATSGEPLLVRLVEPLRERGHVIAPAGTEAIGQGSAFDDGTGTLRLVIRFTRFVLPTGAIRRWSATSYSADDGRLGLRVPVNRQIARHGRRLALRSLLTLGMYKVADQYHSGSSVYTTPSPAQQVATDAGTDALKSVQDELKLNDKPPADLFTLPAGQRMLVVFGLDVHQ